MLANGARATRRTVGVETQRADVRLGDDADQSLGCATGKLRLKGGLIQRRSTLSAIPSQGVDAGRLENAQGPAMGFSPHQSCQIFPLFLHDLAIFLGHKRSYELVGTSLRCVRSRGPQGPLFFPNRFRSRRFVLPPARDAHDPTIMSFKDKGQGQTKRLKTGLPDVPKHASDQGTAEHTPGCDQLSRRLPACPKAPKSVLNGTKSQGPSLCRCRPCPQKT